MFILVFIFTILVLVIIHELGHFFAAKKFGIKVLEFGFGLPPRAWGKQIGETIWSLNWLPFGGFVRLLGEDETDPKALNDKRSFATQAVWKRIIVVVAGVFMNLILAFVLYWILLGIQGFHTKLPLLTNHKFVGVEQTNTKEVVISDVLKGSPADQVGIKPNDRVIAINGLPVADAEQLIKVTKENAGKKTALTIGDLDKKNLKTVEVTPRVDPPKGEGALGVSLGSYEFAELNYQKPYQKILSGPIHTYNVFSYTLDVLGKLVQTSQKQNNFGPVASGVGGPIAIAYTLKDILALQNAKYIIDLMANMSLVLAVMNVLPIPALDGGRLFFLIIEAITKKRVPANIEAKVHAVGMVCLLLLILLITYKDIRVYILKLAPF